MEIYVEGLYGVAVSDEPGGLRIGELARRTGVTPELLRAWEQRYGLLEPSRSAGGFRLYSGEDERRVRRMTELIAQGLSAAEAAQRARAGAGRQPSPDPLVAGLARELQSALDRFDSAVAHAVIDRLLATVTVETAIEEVLLPSLRELGRRWAEGAASVAQEHFASSLLRGRLLGLARDWGDRDGPTALLACLPEERHDLGLIAFGILLARRGWRVTFLGADTPLDTLTETVATLRPAAVVLVTVDNGHLHRNGPHIRTLAGTAPVYVAVTDAVRPDDVTALGARPLTGGIAAAARELAV